MCHFFGCGASQKNMALTDTKLKSLHGKKRNERTEFPDREGLVAVAGLTGKVTWVYRYRFEGKSKRLKLGTYPSLSLLNARGKMAERKAVLEGGADPKSVDDKGEEFKGIEACRDHWFEHYVHTLSEKTQATHKSNGNKYFVSARFNHDVRLARFEDWISYFDKIAEETSRVNSGHMLKVTKSMLRFCKSRNFIDRSKALDIQLKAVGKASEIGQRNLSMKEVGVLWGMVSRSHATPAIKICSKLLLVFGARNSEIREAQRNEFDLDQGIWILPKERSKTKKAIRRAIPEIAKQLIQELDQTYGDEGFLIPGSHRGTCMTVHSLNRFITRTWGKIHTVNGTEKFTPHDFRRTLSTRLSEKGVLPHVTEKMLGHELQGVMAVYNKHDWIDEQAKAYELWGGMITEAAKTELSGIGV